MRGTGEFIPLERLRHVSHMHKSTWHNPSSENVSWSGFERILVKPFLLERSSRGKWLEKKQAALYETTRVKIIGGMSPKGLLEVNRPSLRGS